MSDLGGFAEGAIAGQQYSQAQQLFGFTLTQEGQKVQANELGLQKEGLAVKTGEIALQQQAMMLQKWAARSKGGGVQSGPQDSTAASEAIANDIFDAAQDNMAVGRFAEGGKLATQASTILKNNATIANQHYAQQNKLFKDAADVMGNAPDTAAGWDQAKLMFQTLHPEEAKNPEIQKLMGMKWQPGLVNIVKNSVLDSKQKAETSAANARAVASLASARHSDYMVAHVLPEQVKKSEAQIAALKKAGAGHLVPKPTDINQIVDLALPHFPGQADTAEGKAALRDMSIDVAQQAKIYEASGMQRGAAQRKAFQEAFDRNHFAGLPRSGMKDLGTSVDKPFPTPKPPDDFPTWSQDKKAAWIKKNVKENMFYVTAKGTQIWDGTSWKDPEAAGAVETDDDLEDDE